MQNNKLNISNKNIMSKLIKKPSFTVELENYTNDNMLISNMNTGKIKLSTQASILTTDTDSSSKNKKKYNNIKQKIINLIINNLEFSNDITYYISLLKYYFMVQKQYNFADIYKEHFYLSFNNILLSKKFDINNLKHPIITQLPQKKHNKKYTIFLDLEETLIHTRSNLDAYNTNNYHKKIKITTKDNNKLYYYLYIRPYLTDFLEGIYKDNELIIFSNSENSYLKHIIKEIDPDKKYFDLILNIKYCSKLDNSIIKNLNLLNRDLSTCIIIDNNNMNFILNLENGIPIIPFYGDKNDIELLMLQKFITQILSSNLSIQEFITNYFKLYHFFKCKNINELFMLL